jgi:uncharacterized repeat protein (TIGR02059 family)
MASSVIRRAWFGWANPNAPAQTTPKTATGSTVTLGFSGAILPASPAIAQFACTVNGVARGVTAAACAGSTLTLTLASAVTAAQTVVVTYTPGGVSPLRNSTGDLVSGFTVSIIAT